MNQTKRNWLAALFATLAAVLLAAALCFALPFSDRRASGATVTVSDAAELQRQMAAAQEGDTIQLSADITIPSSALGSQSLGLYASKGHKSQTLDLNGHKLSIETGNSDACFIVSGLTFTVVNSVPDQGGLAGKSHGSFVKGYKDANLILRDIEITFENNSGSASTAPVVAGFENRLTLDNVTYQLTHASKPYVANIAGSNYTDLAAAVGAASDGQKVQLVASFEEAVTIPAGKNITLDLNGNTLTNEAGHHTITNNGTLTITDPAGGGVVDNISHACSAVRNNVGGTVVFSGGTFTRSKEAGIDTEDNGGNSCYVLQNFGEMKVNKGVTVSMKSGYSSLFENGWYDGTQNATQAEAVLTINGGTFSGGLNTIKNDDWGVLTINGGKFTNMQQHAVLNWNKMEINGGTFEVTDDSGAVVYVGFANDSMDQGKLTITGGTFNGGLCAVYANTGTDIEISDGTFNSRVYALSGAMIAITGGTFNHSVYSASCENFISGGTFTMEFPAAEYMADNCSMNSDGTVSDTAPVAQLDRGGTLYAFASLDDALGLAAEGDTVTLLADLSIASAIKIEKGITFDLNGHDISGACSSILIISADDVTVTNSGADESVIELLPTGMQQSSVTVINVINQESAISVRIENITVRHSGEDNIQQVSGIQAAYLVDVTLDNIRMEIGSPANLVLGVFVYGDEASASIANSDIRVDKAGREAHAVHSQWADVTITNTQIETNDSGVVIVGKSDNSAVDEAISADKATLPTLTLNNSEVNAEIFAVCGNGLSHGTVINIIDSIIVSRSAQAIYHPQYGYLTISGDTSVTGVTGIEMRAGNLIVEDGTITATGAFSQLAYGGGSTLGGVAVGVSQHTTDLPVSVTLEGGTYTATDASGYALYEVDLQNNVGTDKIEIDVRDGIFMSAVFSENAEAFISGGTFTMEFPAAEYVAENCSLTQYGVVTDIAPAAELEKDGKVYAFATIADALVLASRGDTITLVGNVTENVVIAKNKVVTLDLNGYTLTNATGERGDHTILNNGTLTIIDGSYAGTGRVITTGGQNCAAVYNAIGGEVTLDGGTYTSNRTTGDYYIIQNHGAMTINDGVTVLQPSVVSSGIASGWYTLAEESQTTYLTINGGTFASNRITVKNDEINVLVINGGTFDQTEGYGDASYEVQSVQNWAIGILGGGTFGANVQSWAYQSGAGIVRGSLDITGGVYLGTVSAHYYINNTESKEDDTPDVEISGGAFASQPAEKFLTAGFTTVSNSEGMFTVVGENSAEADALRTAQVNAQADVGQYLATLGLKDFDLASDDPYTGIQDDEVSLADETAAVNAALTALRTAYADIAAARSEYDVAGARLAAMDAADALADALAAELSAYKAAATASIEEAAAATEQVGDTPAQEAVVVPTATYLAINSAETAEQVKQYWDNALQEISDIRTYRSGIEGQIDSLNALLTALNSEVLGADGTDGLRTVIIDAITTAQNAVMGASEGDTGSSLKDVYDFLDTRIEDVILEIRTELIGSDGQSGALGALQTDITTLLGLFAKDSEGYYTLQNVITEIGNAKDTILTGGENSVSAAIQAIGGVADSVVDALTKEDGALTELSKGIAEVRALLVTTGAGSEEINRLESLAQAIEQAVDDIAGGDFTLSSLNTAIADAQRELTGAIGTLETTVSGYNTLLGNYNTQLGTLSGTLADLNSGLTKDIAAAQADIDVILADLAAVATDGDVTALSKAIGEISASLAQMQATVESIAAQVSAATPRHGGRDDGRHPRRGVYRRNDGRRYLREVGTGVQRGECKARSQILQRCSCGNRFRNDGIRSDDGGFRLQGAGSVR